MGRDLGVKHNASFWKATQVRFLKASHCNNHLLYSKLQCSKCSLVQRFQETIWDGRNYYKLAIKLVHFQIRGQMTSSTNASNSSDNKKYTYIYIK